MKNPARMTMRLHQYVELGGVLESDDAFGDIGLSIRDLEYTEFASWRSELSIPTVQRVESICRNIMNRFGYYPLSGDTRNTAVPSVGKVEGTLPYYLGL